MAQLDLVLSDLEAIVGELKDASKLADEERKRAVVSARQRLADRMRDLVAAASADPRLKANASLGAEFSKRMTVWRHDLSQFQARWRVAEADVTSGEYAGSVAALRDSNAAFLRWARGSLALG